MGNSSSSEDEEEIKFKTKKVKGMKVGDIVSKSPISRRLFNLK